MTLLLISSDAIDTHMAGPGIRYWEFARYLSQRHAVILMTPNRSALSHPNVQLVQHTPQALKDALGRADVIITQGYLYPIAPLLLCSKPLVVDLYDPLPIELLEHHAHLPLNEAQLSQSYCVERTRQLLRRGDFFLYSNARQRAYWLGMLTAAGRVNHAQYRIDPAYATLLDCVPYGISDEPPSHTRNVLRGAGTPFEFSEYDTIILWGGGLWQWFDPGSVIQAMAAITQTRQDIKLVFLAAKPANPEATGINIASASEAALALSQQTGVYNRTVFFQSAWVPYEDRQNYLLEADIGISTHRETIETEFAFRTRILDYLWAELPILATHGDSLSQIVAEEALGIVVDPTSVEQLQEAILRLADDHALRLHCQENIRRIRQQLFWSQVLQPLATFCDAPYRTSQQTGLTRRWNLLNFYAHTGYLLMRYRGYKKLFAKFLRKYADRKLQ